MTFYAQRNGKSWESVLSIVNSQTVDPKLIPREDGEPQITTGVTIHDKKRVPPWPLHSHSPLVHFLTQTGISVQADEAVRCR